MEMWRANVARTRWGRCLVAMGCVCLGACDRYEPSREPGIELPRFERTFEQSDMSPSVLEFRRGSYNSYRGWSGFSVRRDGTVWTYDAHVSQRCADIRSPSARLDCLSRGSRLAARLNQDLRDNLIVASEAANPVDLETADVTILDGGFATLFLVRPGLPEDMLPVGQCSATRYSQLLSKQGEDLLDLYRALRRATPEVPEPWSCPLDDGSKPSALPESFDWWKR